MVETLETQTIAARGWSILTLAGNDEGLRPYHGFIYQTWLRSLKYGNGWFDDIDTDTYYQVYDDVIKRIMLRPNTQFKLAVLPDDFDILLGWACFEHDALHYVFVKQEIGARNQGIATSLVPRDVTTVTHLTKVGRRIWKKHKNIIFNPFR